MKILLIAGHGAGDPGATATIGGAKITEAEETRSLAALTAAALTRRYAVTASVFDPARNAYTDLSAGRLKKDVFSEFDYVLELHFNACTASPADGKTKGVECYVTNDEKSVGVELQICAKLSALGLTNRGVRRKNFSVISAAKKAGVSSALLGVCFLDDPDDMAVYLKDRAAVAKAIAEGIAAGFGLAAKPRTSREIVQQTAGLSDATMDYLAKYRWGKDLLDKLAAATTKK